MANLPELNEFTTGIYQIETADPVLGGVDGVTNVPLKALANRTKWLKAQVDALNAAIEETIDAAYVAAELNKLAYKAPVRVATTTNITLSGLQTIDGVSVTAGERVLVKNQSTGAQNGIYLAQVSSWVRAADMNDDSEVMPGMAVVVSGGTNQADTIWMLSTDGTVTVGTTAMTFKNAIAGLAPIDSPAFTGNATVSGNFGVGGAATGFGAGLSVSQVTGATGGYHLQYAGTIVGHVAVDTGYAGQLIGTRSAHPVIFTYNNAEEMRLTNTGLALGVIPNAWSYFKALQMGAGSLSSLGTDEFNSSQNSYYASDFNWKHVATGAASQYRQGGGVHRWFFAPSGVTGSNVAFNQAMTLDANGLDVLLPAKANTPAQFDSSRNLASTEFVQRAIGNARGFAGFTTNTSLTAAHAGMEIYASSTGGTITLSLPAANALPAGAQYRIFNTGVSDVIVSRVGSDTIVVNNTTNTVTAVTLKSGDSIVLTSLGTGNLWYHGGGTARLIHAGGLKTALNASGDAPIYACRAWVNFNGTGTVAIRASGNVSSITDNGVGDYTVNFTTAMPDVNYTLTGTCDATTNHPARCVSLANGVTPGASSVRVTTGLPGANTVVGRFDDCAYVYVAIFR